MFLRLFKLILTSAGNTRKYVLKVTNLPLMSYKEIVSKQSNKLLATNHIRNIEWYRTRASDRKTRTLNACRIKKTDFVFSLRVNILYIVPECMYGVSQKSRLFKNLLTPVCMIQSKRFRIPKCSFLPSLYVYVVR